MENINLHVKGIFSFEKNLKSRFKGPVKKGFRPIVWIESRDCCTSCSFVLNTEIFVGEVKVTEIVVLSPNGLHKHIEIGTTLSVGSTVDEIGKFEIVEIIGYWTDKIP
jgi:hypothetical protein